MKKRFTLLLFSLLLLTFSCSKAEKHTHAYKETVVPPTCTADGYTECVCECGDRYVKDTVSKTGHSFAPYMSVEATCIKDGYVTEKCGLCGEEQKTVIKCEGHKTDEPRVEISSSNKGNRYIVCGDCTVCGKKSVVISTYAVSPAISDTLDGELRDIGKGGSVTLKQTTMGLSVTAKAETGFIFLGWTDGVTKAERVENEIKSDIYAVFAYEHYTLPVMNIVTAGDAEVVRLDPYVDCKISMLYCDDKYAFEDADAGIRVRGNASSNYGDSDWIRQNKVHYRIKFDKRTSVLGVNSGAECKSWVLLRGDSNFMKELIPDMMLNRFTDRYVFAPDYTFVSVYINYKYYGVYVLCDQIQIDKYRINIDEKEDDDTDIFHGYLLEIDNYYSKEPYNFTVDYGGVKLTDIYGVTKTVNGVGYSVKYDEMTEEQLAFLKKYISNAYTICYRAIYKNDYYRFNVNYDLVKFPEAKNSKEVVEKVLDLDSVASMYILRELAAERDGGIGSFFMYVDFTEDEPRLNFAAPWDFSWAFGDGMGYRYDKLCVGAWQPQEFINSAGNRSFTWFITLYHEDWFVDIVKEKWQRCMKEGGFDDLINEMDRVTREYKEDFRMNSERWGCGDQEHAMSSTRAWLIKRIDFLDSLWGK